MQIKDCALRLCKTFIRSYNLCLLLSRQRHERDVFLGLRNDVIRDERPNSFESGKNIILNKTYFNPFSFIKPRKL